MRVDEVREILPAGRVVRAAVEIVLGMGMVLPAVRAAARITVRPIGKKPVGSRAL